MRMAQRVILTPVSRRAIETSAKAALRVLVIGAGPMATAIHLPLLSMLRDGGDMELKVVCDLQSVRAAAAQLKFGFTEHTGDAAAAIARDDIDVVYIFGSAQLHHEYGLAALRNGKHLFVEKPIAPSYAEALGLARAARLQGRVAVGGHNRRFYQSLAAVRNRAGRSGWRFAEAVLHKPVYGKPPPFGARTWLGSNGIHALDALIYMMGGLPAQLTALTGESSSAAPTAFSVLMRWPDGAQGVFLCNNDAGARREEYVFHAAGETCRVDAAGVAIEREGLVSTLSLPALNDGFAEEHRSFIHAIRSGTPPPHSIASLAPSLFLTELIEKGFSGPVALPADPLPQPAPSHALTPPPSETWQASSRAARCILVDHAAELYGPLARLLPHHRLVSLNDVESSTTLASQVEAAILGRGSAPLSSDTLAALPRLGLVGIVGLSLARHSPDALLARNVHIVNASAAYAESVAEFALALAILGRRRAFLSHESMRRGGWGVSLRTPGIKGMTLRAARALRPALKAIALEPLLLLLWRAMLGAPAASAASVAESRNLSGATVGLIGWGANARAFAERLSRSNATVRVYSDHATRSEVQDAGGVLVSLSEALAADIVSLHRGLTSATRHGLGAAELAKIRPGAVLINVARGALIEPRALLDRLRKDDIFACLDTYDQEPLPASDPLRALPNVFLTSHIAGGSRDMNADAAEEVVRKVAAELDGRPVEPISEARFRTMT